MRVVLLLQSLLARGVQIMTADSDDVIAAVCRGVVDGLVFAHEMRCDGGGDAAETARVFAYVYVVPYSGVGEA